MKTSSMQFSNPVLTECTFNVNDNYKQNKEGHEAILETELGIGNKDNDKRECIVLLRLTICADKNNNNFPYFIKIAMLANFKWEEELDNKIDDLLKINAPALLLGYMRPIVATLTNNSPYDVYNIPFMNFTDTDKGIIVSDLK